MRAEAATVSRLDRRLARVLRPSLLRDAIGTLGRNGARRC